MADRMFFEEYDNIYKFMDVIHTRPNNGRFDNSSSSKGDKGWYGTESYEEAENLFANGIPEVADELKKDLLEFKCKTNITSTKSRPHNYYYGYSPNVPAAIIGLPKSMKRVERFPQKVKAISIYYDCGANGNTSGTTLANCGKTILKMIYAMECKGYRVRLLLSVRTAKERDEVMMVNVLMKDWKQPLDILKLSFPLTNPSMYRRFGFKAGETMPGVQNSWGGYGRHLDKDQILYYLPQCGVDTKNTVVIVPRDCQEVDYDPIELAKYVGIIL